MVGFPRYGLAAAGSGLHEQPSCALDLPRRIRGVDISARLLVLHVSPGVPSARSACVQHCAEVMDAVLRADFRSLGAKLSASLCETFGGFGAKCSRELVFSVAGSSAAIAANFKTRSVVFTAAVEAEQSPNLIVAEPPSGCQRGRRSSMVQGGYPTAWPMTISTWMDFPRP